MFDNELFVDSTINLLDPTYNPFDENQQTPEQVNDPFNVPTPYEDYGTLDSFIESYNPFAEPSPQDVISDPCGNVILQGEKPPMADFIQEQDKIPAYIACIMYDSPLPKIIAGYQLDQNSTHYGVWKKGTEAIVGLRGTNVGGDGGLQDVQDDIRIVLGQGCELQIVSQVRIVVADLYMQGFQITLAGHSLGGKAAMCLSSLPGVKYTVALNPGTPVVAENTGGNINGRAYHIVGDVISTHPYGIQTIRVKLGQEITNWLSTYHHGTARFLQKAPFTYVSPQWEQNDLEMFIFVRSRTALSIANVTTSLLNISWYREVKELVCARPIPGSNPGKLCASNASLFSKITPVSFGIAGALLGLLKGPEGAVQGWFIGYGIAEGNLSSVLDAMLPGWDLATKAQQYELISTIKQSLGPKDLISTLESEVIAGIEEYDADGVHNFNK